MTDLAFTPPRERWLGRIAPEKLQKMQRALAKAQELTEKEIRCPHCNYLLERFYGSGGLFRMKCGRCGATGVIDVNDWRRTNAFSGPRSAGAENADSSSATGRIDVNDWRRIHVIF